MAVCRFRTSLFCGLFFLHFALNYFMGELTACGKFKLPSERVLGHLKLTLYLGIVAKERLTAIYNETKNLIETFHRVSADPDPEKKCIIVATSEIKILFNLRSAIDCLEYSSRILTNVWIEIPFTTDRPANFSSQNESTSSKFKGNEIQNEGTEVAKKIRYNPYSEFCSTNFTSQERSIHLEFFDSEQSHPNFPNIKEINSLTQNPSIQKSNTSENLLSSLNLKHASSTTPPRIQRSDSSIVTNSKLMENKSECRMISRSSPKENAGLNESLGLSETQSLQSEAKTSSSVSLRLRGWEAKKAKLKAQGIAIDKCLDCGKPKRSSKEGRSKSHCHCIKRWKESVKSTIKVPYSSKIIYPNDGYSWRKYGSKVTKPGSYARSYYKCTTSKGCQAKRHTQIDADNPDMVTITYFGNHNHTYISSTLNGHSVP